MMRCYHKTIRFFDRRKIAFAAMGVALLASSIAHADWTGDPDTKYWSGVVIKRVAVGQIDGHEYFCIEFTNTTTTINKACASSNPNMKDNSSIPWASSYDGFYKQAMYYYSTGKPVRVHYGENVWKFEKFVALYGANHIRGFSSCLENERVNCFGPSGGQ